MNALEQLALHASEGNWLAYKAMFVCCDDRPGNTSAPARLRWERVASTRARYEHDRSVARTTFHRVPVYAFAQYVPEDTGLEHGPGTLEDAWRADPSGFC